MNARAHFPAGLEQPEGSLRFGADALLLAAFAARHLEQHSVPHPQSQPVSQPVSVAELGSGCGAALLALVLRCPQVAGLGLEREEALVLAARRNAALLGLAGLPNLTDRADMPEAYAPSRSAGTTGTTGATPQPGSAGLTDFAGLADFAGLTGLAAPTGQVRFARLDIADRASLAALAIDAQAVDPLPGGALAGGAQAHAHSSPEGPTRIAGKLHMAMANPPYDTGGRPSPKAMRERALRGSRNAAESEKPLDTFCRAAAMLLRHHGYFFCIHDARALPQLCTALEAARLGVRRILPVHTRAGGPALRVLVEARKNAAHDATLEAALYLHDTPSTGETLWTAQALRFCPWLHRSASGSNA